MIALTDNITSDKFIKDLTNFNDLINFSHLNSGS